MFQNEFTCKLLKLDYFLFQKFFSKTLKLRLYKNLGEIIDCQNKLIKIQR